MSTFPPEIPENCPLPVAVPCNCVVYRGCATAPPQEADFATHAELGLALTAKGEKACMRFGLSVFPTRQACEHMLELFPQNGTHVAKGALTHDHGMIANSPTGRFPSHRTWWPYEGIQRATTFE